MAHRNSRGNRLAVPRELDREHFFYSTRAPELDPKDVALLVAAVTRRWQLSGIRGPHIEAFSGRKLSGESVIVQRAFDRVRTATRKLCPSTREATVDFLVCQWAAPHVDPDYSGIAFYTTVLHTGPYDYLMQTLHSEKSKATDGLPSLITSEKVLKVGDAFVFDPTTPHLAVPEIPHEEQLLILLQTEVEDADEAQRAALLKALPPIKQVRPPPLWACAF